MKCIVAGCNNHSHEGHFIADMCAPCYRMITTGVITRSDNFLYRLIDEADHLFTRRLEAREKLFGDHNEQEAIMNRDYPIIAQHRKLF